ncbi:MAG: hypothetical protein AB1629_06560 [Candidatus Omnitrophota bacterium]
MSKIIDSLKKIQFKRENGYHQDDSVSPVVNSKGNPILKKQNSRPNKNSVGTWFVPLVFVLFMLVTFILNLKLFLMMRDYRSEKDLTLKKVSEIVDLLEKKNKLQSEALSLELKLLTKQNAKLKDELDVQKVATENLTKAKNTLFKRMSAFEAEISSLKPSNPQTR